MRARGILCFCPAPEVHLVQRLGPSITLFAVAVVIVGLARPPLAPARLCKGLPRVHPLGPGLPPRLQR